MRDLPILSDSFYHVYNRGNLKQPLFLDEADYTRFLFLLLHFQSPVVLQQTNRYIKNYLQKGVFGVKDQDIADICRSRFVEVINFCIMPNHFHISVRSVTEGGVSLYMHRVGNAYAKYFNKKYDKSGHVFQGAYKAKLVLSDKQLMYLSAYIHRNPHELEKWRYRSGLYPWSSYQDCRNNRWGDLLLTQEIIQSFDSYSAYEEYIETSGAKEDWEGEL
jgi:putative transposase